MLSSNIVSEPSEFVRYMMPKNPAASFHVFVQQLANDNLFFKAPIPSMLQQNRAYLTFCVKSKSIIISRYFYTPKMFYVLVNLKEQLFIHALIFILHFPFFVLGIIWGNDRNEHFLQHIKKQNDKAAVSCCLNVYVR